VVEVFRNDCIIYSAANLGIIIQALDGKLKLKLPDCHRKFALKSTAEMLVDSAVVPLLRLSINQSQLPGPAHLKNKLCQVENYELWEDIHGRWVFIQPRQSPVRWIVVDQDFESGEILGDFSSLNGGAFFPLQYIDIILYANWLAKYSDLILHAAGIAVDGRGYAFVGQSGIGKSTLMRDLAVSADVTVLGEDQVILRYLNGRFWVFGTPWHDNIDRCSPLGVPLKRVYFLDRNLDQVKQEMGAFEGILRFMQTAFIPYYRPENVKMIMDRLVLLAEQVPFHKLSYTLGTDILPEILSV
jgi:hypothetical protein